MDGEQENCSSYFPPIFTKTFNNACNDTAELWITVHCSIVFKGTVIHYPALFIIKTMIYSSSDIWFEQREQIEQGLLLLTLSFIKTRYHY